MRKKELKKSITEHLHEYLAGDITADEFISKYLCNYILINREREQEINEILTRCYNLTWQHDTFSVKKNDIEEKKKIINKLTNDILYEVIVNEIYLGILSLYESPIVSQLRAALSHLNMAEVAKRSGVSRVTLSNWLDGTSDPRLSKIEAVMRAINEIKSELDIKIS